MEISIGDEVWQKSDTSLLIWSVARLITYASKAHKEGRQTRPLRRAAGGWSVIAT